MYQKEARFFQEELQETVEPEKLLAAAKLYDETTVIQRLGYILECILEESKLSNELYSYLDSVDHYPTLLRPQKDKPDNMITGNRWKVVPNIEIEADI